MLKAFYKSKEWALWAYGGGVFLLLSLYAQVYMSVRINIWYKTFYDILQKPAEHGLDVFWDQIWVFCYIAFPYVLLATITGYFTRLYAFRWRQAMTFDYIPKWRNVDEEIEGASQRIQQDTERFARIVESLGLQVVRAIMTLIAFIPVLWQLSVHVTQPWLNVYPGCLIWAAAMASLGGLYISWKVGYYLPELEYNNQVVEAAYRKELVKGEDDKVNYARPEKIWELFLGLRFNYHRLFLHNGYFDIWLNIYDQFMVIAPYIVMAPGLFTGAMSLGILIQVSNAFQRVHGSFSLFIHNWTTITELRSVIKRLREFEHNLKKHNTEEDRKLIETLHLDTDSKV